MKKTFNMIISESESEKLYESQAVSSRIHTYSRQQSSRVKRIVETEIKI